MHKYSVVATGGTFDLLHKGHLELLRHAFLISSHVIIGLSSDDFAAKRGKITFNNYILRFNNLTQLINKHFASASFEIHQLDDDFGPAVLGHTSTYNNNNDNPEHDSPPSSTTAHTHHNDNGPQALVVSSETHSKGNTLNTIRKQKNLPPVDVITVPLVLAQDGIPISSTRIKNSEIDFDGNELIDKQRTKL